MKGIFQAIKAHYHPVPSVLFDSLICRGRSERDRTHELKTDARRVDAYQVCRYRVCRAWRENYAQPARAYHRCVSRSSSLLTEVERNDGTATRFNPPRILHVRLAKWIMSTCSFNRSIDSSARSQSAHFQINARGGTFAFKVFSLHKNLFHFISRPDGCICSLNNSLFNAMCLCSFANEHR